MTPKKHNAPWLAPDLKRLRALARARMSARLAAKKLGRTTGSVKYKAMVEGVRFHAIKQPRGVQRRPALRRKLARLRKARAS